MAKSYLEQRRALKLKGPKPAKVQRAEDLEMAKFFADALKGAPSKCMECGLSLAGTVAINPTAIVAHIVPKSKVPSIGKHPFNKVYLCGDCHTNMDNKGCDYIRKMKIYKLLRSRVKIMWPEIKDNERRKVPECLKP